MPEIPVIGIDPGPEASHAALYDGGPCMVAGEYPWLSSLSYTPKTVFVVGRCMPQGRPLSGVMIHTIENSIYIASILYSRGDKVYMVPDATARAQLWTVNRCPGETQDRRIIRELGFRGHLKYRVCNKRGALKITEPQHLQSAHTRDA
ncbi:MAG: hypothetical protein WC381_11690, partial [Kiritimatiellia bacterium]